MSSHSLTPLLNSNHETEFVNIHNIHNNHLLYLNDKKQNTLFKKIKSLSMQLVLISFGCFILFEVIFSTSTLMTSSSETIITHRNDSSIDNNNNLNGSHYFDNLDNSSNETKIAHKNDSNIDNNNKVNGTNYLDNLENDEDEKYLTFLPHSGLHNQRIGIENAIFISWFLNRTLVVPPALLGSRFQYIRIIHMKKYLKAKPVNLICKNIKKRSQKQKCNIFHNSYTLYPFDQLFDFTFARQNIKIMNVPDYNYNTVYEILNIKKKNEVYYSFTNNNVNKLYDTESKSNIKKLNGNTFIELQSLQDLKKRPEKLLYFGSLFGTNRIILNLKSSKTFIQKLRRSLLPVNPIMLNVVASIAEKMSGAGKYISAHARGADSSFKKQVKGHFAKLVSDINEKFPGISKYSSSLKTCPLSSTEPRDDKNRILYVASDLNKNAKSMEILLNEFPCLKMLSDFTDQLKPYEHFINPIDNKVMHDYLMPLTDLMVAANSLEPFVIPHSTFGIYMKRYNSILSANF